MWGLAAFIALIALILGVISIIVPLRKIGIKSRSRGALLAVVSLVAVAWIGSQIEPKERAPTGLAPQSALEEPRTNASTKSPAATKIETPRTAEGVSPAPAAAPVLTAISLAPEEQNAFVEVIDRHRSAYQSAKNDMAKGAQRPARAQSLCNILHDRKVSNWTGYVSTLTTNSDGLGVVTIELGPKVSVGTWNNALSDVMDQTLIPPNSQVFRQAVNLSEGAPVKFSGRLFGSQTDCIQEKSVTMDGSMRSPEFLIRFTAIEPLVGIEAKRRSSILKRLLE